MSFIKAPCPPLETCGSGEAPLVPRPLHHFISPMHYWTSPETSCIIRILHLTSWCTNPDIYACLKSFNMQQFGFSTGIRHHTIDPGINTDPHLSAIQHCTAGLSPIIIMRDQKNWSFDQTVPSLLAVDWATLLHLPCLCSCVLSAAPPPVQPSSLPALHWYQVSLQPLHLQHYTTPPPPALHYSSTSTSSSTIQLHLLHYTTAPPPPPALHYTSSTTLQFLHYTTAPPPPSALHYSSSTTLQLQPCTSSTSAP